MKKISKWKTVWQPILLLGLMLFNWFSAAFKYLSKRSKRIFAMMLVLFTLIPNVQAFALNVGDKTTIERKWVDVYYDFNYNGHYYGQFSILTAKSLLFKTKYAFMYFALTLLHTDLKRKNKSYNIKVGNRKEN